MRRLALGRTLIGTDETRRARLSAFLYGFFDFVKISVLSYTFVL